MLSLPGGAGLSPILGEARRLADFTLPAGTFKRFDLEQVVRLLLDVLGGLAALHEVAIDGEAFVHGEVSPQHVYIDEHGTARLVPLLSSHFTGSSKAEHPGYLAPERLAGEAVDVRADVFSVGVMLWEALAGQRLFPNPSLEGVRARLAGPLAPQLSARDRWAQPLCAIAVRSIAAEPALRFRTAVELSHAMATAAAQQLSRVDADAWQEEAPTPVFQPRLHLSKLRGATPPPLPSVRSADSSPPSFETAPPTSSSELPSEVKAASRGYRRTGVVVATLAALAAVAAVWFAGPRAPHRWRQLLTGRAASAQALSIRAAASPREPSQSALQLEQLAPSPSVTPSSAPPFPPASAAGVGSAATSARPKSAALAASAAVVTKPKSKPRRDDYGI